MVRILRDINELIEKIEAGKPIYWGKNRCSADMVKRAGFFLTVEMLRDGRLMVEDGNEDDS